MSGFTVTREAFRLMALVPEYLVSLAADDLEDETGKRDGRAASNGKSSGSGETSNCAPDDGKAPSDRKTPGDGKALGDEEWAAWLACTPVDGRSAVLLVSITVTALGTADAAAGTADGAARTGDALLARVRARYPEGAVIEEFTTQDGSQAVSVRRVATKRVGGRDIATGQAQALVLYPGPGALGIVSGVALDPADLDRAADLVTGIAAGMTVTGASAAA